MVADLDTEDVGPHTGQAGDSLALAQGLINEGADCIAHAADLLAGHESSTTFREHADALRELADGLHTA